MVKPSVSDHVEQLVREIANIGSHSHDPGSLGQGCCDIPHAKMF